MPDEEGGIREQVAGRDGPNEGKDNAFGLFEDGPPPRRSPQIARGGRLGSESMPWSPPPSSACSGPVYACLYWPRCFSRGERDRGRRPHEEEAVKTWPARVDLAKSGQNRDCRIREAWVYKREIDGRLLQTSGRRVNLPASSLCFSLMYFMA